MNNFLITSELVKTIQQERLHQAQMRRERSKRLARGSTRPMATTRMAIGPGLQVGGVTEQMLETVEEPVRAVKAA